MTRFSLLSPVAGAAVVAGMLALSAGPAVAASCDTSYSGPAHGAWDVGANWSGGSVPTAAQDVCVPAGAGPVSIAAGVTAHALLISAQAEIDIDTGGTLAIADGTDSAAHLSTLADVHLDGTLSTAGSWIDLYGNVTLDNAAITGPGTAELRLQGGSLAGVGVVEPSFTAVAGTVAPGGAGAVGQLDFGAVFTVQAAATLAIDLTSDSSFDTVSVPNNDAWIGGTIAAAPLGAYAPAVGATFTILTSGYAVSNIGWTVTPSNWSAHNISRALQITLNAPPPAPPSGGGGGGGTGGTPAPPSGGGATTSGAPAPSPGAAPAPAGPATAAPLAAPTVTAASQRLLLGCTDQRLVLTDVYESGGRVRLAGTAALDLVGQPVSILFAGAKQPVATALVQPGGVFATTAPQPAAKIETTNKARYTAVDAAGQRSLDLKLQRRLILQPPRRTGATITLTGHVTKPLTRPTPQPVTIAQQTACGTWTTVKRFTPSPSGRFTVTVPAPANAPAANYRLQTAVPKTTKNPKAYNTFSLPVPVLLAG